MMFGQPTDFAIEAYHEPSGPEWGGCGRLCIHIQGTTLGDIRDNHCSLFQVTDRFRELVGLPMLHRYGETIETLWHESFDSLSDTEIFGLIDQARYVGEPSESGPRYDVFDFLTNTGEMFNSTKTFIACHPNGNVHILCQFRDNTFGFFACGVRSFRSAADTYVRWFDEQVRTTAPPFFPINPFDPNEFVPDK
jgi:hypothetical protein